MIFIPPPPTSRQIGRKLGKLLATMRKLQTPVKPQPTTPQHTMSTTTQRPTPETDAVANTAWDGATDDYSAYAKMLSHARKLERERDEARVQLEAMREAIKDIYFLTEGCADGAPDASAHDKLCNEVAAKLQPFIKP